MKIEEFRDSSIKDINYVKSYAVTLAESPALCLFVDRFKYKNDGDEYLNTRIIMNGYTNFDIEITLPGYFLDSLAEAISSIKKKIEEDRL